MKETIEDKIMKYLDEGFGGVVASIAKKAASSVKTSGKNVAAGAKYLKKEVAKHPDAAAGGAMVGTTVGAAMATIATAIATLQKRLAVAKTPEEKERIKKQIDQKKEQLRDKKGRFAKE